MSPRTLLRAGLLLTISVVVLRCSYLHYRGIEVSVRNVDAAALRNVTVEVTGGTYPLGDIAPGATASVYVRPTSESHVALVIGAPPHRLEAGGYFEPGSTGTIALDVTDAQVVNRSFDISAF